MGGLLGEIIPTRALTRDVTPVLPSVEAVQARLEDLGYLAAPVALETVSWFGRWLVDAVYTVLAVARGDARASVRFLSHDPAIMVNAYFRLRPTERGVRTAVLAFVGASVLEGVYEDAWALAWWSLAGGQRPHDAPAPEPFTP